MIGFRTLPAYDQLCRKILPRNRRDPSTDATPTAAASNTATP